MPPTGSSPTITPSLVDPLSVAESARISAVSTRTREYKADLGQYLTPWQTADVLATLAGSPGPTVRLLDPGAGAGALTAAWVQRMLASGQFPESVHIVTYECDLTVVPYLAATLTACETQLERAGVKVTIEKRMIDFIEDAVGRLEQGLFSDATEQYDVVLMNPPYKKLSSTSEARLRMRGIGLEVTNLYAAFVALGIRLLRHNGRFVAITPRSFCNGPYFRAFRKELLDSLALTDVHLFNSRSEAFKEDAVLQENLIFAGTKSKGSPDSVRVTLSDGPDDPATTVRQIPFEEVVHPGDLDRFIHLPIGAIAEQSTAAVLQQPATLQQLGFSVSTGRVVDFRAKTDWLDQPGEGDVPLLYAGHFVRGTLGWPKDGFKKPNALRNSDSSRPLLVRNGAYVLVKRFSAKEERRRIVAYFLAPGDLPGEWLGIENHLNYFHLNGGPLPTNVAAGLSCYLNSAEVDSYFRSFNGHTQVNATDLRSLRYPHLESLLAIGLRWLAEGRHFQTSSVLGQGYFADGS